MKHHAMSSSSMTVRASSDQEWFVRLGAVTEDMFGIRLTNHTNKANAFISRCMDDTKDGNTESKLVPDSSDFNRDLAAAVASNPERTDW